MASRDLNDETTPEIVEILLSKFSEDLRTGTIPEFDPYLRRCPEELRQELCSLMNTLVLADRALRSFQDSETEDSSVTAENAGRGD